MQLQQENTQLKMLCHSESEKVLLIGHRVSHLIFRQQHEIPFLQSQIKEIGVELEIRQKEYSDLLKSNQRLEDHNTVMTSVGMAIFSFRAGSTPRAWKSARYLQGP